METLRFDELNLSPQILRAVKEMGFEEASPIQCKAIPVAMTGADIIGQAQTGTGKTAAFGIPVLEKVKKEIKHPQTLVLCPTRELAVQAAEEVRKLAKYMHGVKVLPIWRAGHYEAYSGIKGNTDYYRYAGACYGPSAQKDNTL